MPQGKPRKPIAYLIEELRSWLPNYDHGEKEYPTVLYRILASAPGGEELEDVGYEPFNLGWHEIDQLGRVLVAIQDKRDVEDIVQALLHEGDEEEQVEESVRRNPMARTPSRTGGGETVVRGSYEAMKLPDGQWRLSYRGRVLGVYPSEGAAMDAASEHAFRSGKAPQHGPAARRAAPRRRR